MNNKEQNILEDQTKVVEEIDKNIALEANNNISDKESISVEEDIKDKKIADLECQLVEIQIRERDNILRVKAEMENLRRRTEQDIDKAYKFSLERFVIELLPVIDSLDRALEVSDKNNPDMIAMVEGIELTLKSMLDTMRKFGVEVISDINVPLNPNVHQAIAMVESESVTAGNVITIMQKGYTLNGRTIRAAMVTVAKS